MVSTIVPQFSPVVSCITPQQPDTHAEMVAGRAKWRNGDRIEACTTTAERLGWTMAELDGQMAYLTAMEAEGFPAEMAW